MGIGLRSLRIEAIDVVRTADQQVSKPALSLDLHGVVYTSVLNPGDDRKNWIDMLTAFCWAFRDVDDATLVLKMTHHSISAFLGTFHYHLQRIGPVKCRVLLLHGFLEHEQYRQLIEVSTYYVNSSRCEGLCLPLMEFMSSAVPAVAPCNTAMEDYVSTDSVFIVRSSHEPGIWPHDPRNLLRALRYRIDWSSLAAQFSASYDVAKSDPARYRKMSAAASRTLRDFCSDAVVADKLKRFFKC
jgi:glycosyltransferase involved in cell wall biosynthesis